MSRQSPRDLDGARSSLSFRSEAERALWARLCEAAFAHALRSHGSLEDSVRSAVDVADRLVVELRERSGELPRVEALSVPARAACLRCGAGADAPGCPACRGPSL